MKYNRTRPAGESGARIQIILSMVIFGTIGIFRRLIPLPSGMIAMMRGLTGSIFLAAVMAVRGIRPDTAAVRRKLILLCASGCMMGFNWIFLFEAYRYTSVAAATVCYYMAPVFVLIASPFLLHERMTRRQMLCVPVALLGVVLVSGIIDTGVSGASELRGILLGLAAAMLYACVILSNKHLGSVPVFEKTVLQLFSAGAVLIPYVLTAERSAPKSFTPASILLLAVVCVIHTGAAYVLYFGSIDHLRAHSVALLSYIDPVVAVILSALLLRERLGIAGIVGAVLVIGAAVLSEF
ncbi:MAG: DMT family transporter [Lachnospiraceae bacterium]|nr:DMT family transporter [Lachnospiraceae bacterium]